MTEGVKAWYDKKWLMPALAVLTFISMPFREDIREVVLEVVVKALGVKLGGWLFDVTLAVGLIGLVVVLSLKIDRAARACEDLKGQLDQDFANHRQQLNCDLANYRKQLQEDSAVLVDSKLKPINEGIGTLNSKVSALDSRLAALDSRMAALDSQITALKEVMARPTNTT